MTSKSKKQPNISFKDPIKESFMLKVSLEELHKKVWEQPLLKLAKHWNINATALGKLCDKEGIPRPGSGYWTQVSVGKAPSIPAIPGQLDKNKHIDLSCLQSNKKEKLQLPVVSKIKLTVPKAMHKPHPFTVIAKQKYHKPTFEYDKLMVGAWQGDTYQINVSLEQFPRAIRIMDTLLKYFEKQGWLFKVEKINGQRAPTNIVTANGYDVSFRLREKSKQTLRELNKKEAEDKAAGRYVYYEKVNMPTGNLMLILSEYVDGNCQTSFIDKSDFKVEDNLGAFIESILLAVEYRKQWNIERQKKELKQEQSNDKRRHFDKLVTEEVSRISFLFEQYDNWQKTEKAREFVNAVRNRMLSQGELSENQQEWLNWADSILTHDDPIKLACIQASMPSKSNAQQNKVSEFAIESYFGFSARVSNKVY